MALEIIRATHTGFVDFIVHGPHGSDRRTAHLQGLHRDKARFHDCTDAGDVDESDVDALIAAIEAEQERHAEKLADHRIDASMGQQ